jgi:anti-sigma B factor antagonist
LLPAAPTEFDVAVSTDQYNGVCVVTVVGDLGGEDAAALVRTVDDAVRLRTATDFVVDLAACDFIDSAGLEALLRARRRCDGAGGRIELANLGATCRQILEITRLAQRFECHGGLAGAPKAVR